MDFAFTTEQALLQDSARDFFAAEGGSARMRALAESPPGYDRDVWRRMAAGLGWAGLAVPEGLGGLGLGMVELAIIQEQSGAALYPSPLLATVGLALPAIVAGAGGQQRAALLAPIVAGERTASLAYAGRAGIPGAVDAVLERRAGRLALSGEAGFVPYGHAVDLIVVAARSDDGLRLVAVPRETPGLEADRVTYLDPTRPMARLRFQAVPVNEGMILAGDGPAALRRALDLGTIALAAEQLGGAERCLALATEHAGQRVAFGRPIGSFQAIKHMLADMVVRIETARSAVYYAACIADEDGGPEALAEAAAMVSVHCGEAYYRTAADTIQIHGGMGFTWEHDAHLHFKRARCGQTMLGDAAAQCERVALAMALA